jgi:hypothetical protein
MTLTYRGPRILVMAVCLTLAALACNMPSPRIAGPEPPPDAPVASDEAFESFTDKVENLGSVPPVGPFSVTFTEAELTSALAEGIVQQEAGTGEALPFQIRRCCCAMADSVYPRCSLTARRSTGWSLHNR